MTDNPAIPILDDAERRYRAMSRAFEAAREAPAGGASEFSMLLSGVPARLRIAGRALAARVVRPFRHLEAPHPSPSARLTIDLWDQTETGVACDGCAIDESLTAWGEWKCSADGRFLVHHRRTAMEIYDRRDRRILGWSIGPLFVSHHERGRPLLKLLIHWHRDNRTHLIHGGLVETDGVGVLLVGKGGCGKSTTAMLCTLDGMTFLSEDFLAIGRGPLGEYLGYSIYGSAKLHPDHLERFPRLNSVALPPEHPEDDKSLLFLDDLPGAKIGVQVPIGAVVAPRIADSDGCRFHRIGSGKALMDLAPSTLLLLNAYGLGVGRGEVISRQMDGFGDLLNACPCYRLDLGRDTGAVAPAIRDIVADARRSRRAGPAIGATSAFGDVPSSQKSGR